MTWKDHRAGHAEMSHGGTCLGLGRLIDDVLMPGLGGSTMEATWKPHEKRGELTERSNLPDSVFAFPQQRKEPMTDASHLENRYRAVQSDHRRVRPRSGIGLRQYQEGGQAFRRRDVRDGLARARQAAEHGPNCRRPQEVCAKGGEDAERTHKPPAQAIAALGHRRCDNLVPCGNDVPTELGEHGVMLRSKVVGRHTIGNRPPFARRLVG